MGDFETIGAQLLFGTAEFTVLPDISNASKIH